MTSGVFLKAIVFLGILASTAFATKDNLTDKELEEIVKELVAEEAPPESSATQNETEENANAVEKKEIVQNSSLFTSINNTQLQYLFDLGGVPVIDIRRKNEWGDTGIIAGSTLLTMFTKNGEVEPRFERSFPLLLQPDDQVVLVSETGIRSKVAAEILAEQLGYTKVYVLEDGIEGWLNEDLDIVDP